MDTKDSGSNTKVTSSADRAAVSSTANVPNSNIVEGAMGGTDVKTIDMSGTNLPDATNAKTPAERAADLREVGSVARDVSVPRSGAEAGAETSPHAVRGADNSSDVAKQEQAGRAAQARVSTVQVRLLGAHTHEGIEYEKGDIIDVDEQSAKYLTETAENGVRV